jgi:DNA polymerase zeta
VQDILNRREIQPRPLHHDFIERSNPLAPDQKYVHSMAGLWRDETRRRKARMVDPDPGSSPFPPEVMISMSADPRNSQRGGWIHEEEFAEKINDLILEEESNPDSTTISFEDFVKPHELDRSVQTALESVEDLYPEKLSAALGLSTDKNELSIQQSGDNGEIEVDINRIIDLNNVTNDNSDFSYDSDEDLGRETALTSEKGSTNATRNHEPNKDSGPAFNVGNQEVLPETELASRSQPTVTLPDSVRVLSDRETPSHTSVSDSASIRVLSSVPKTTGLKRAEPDQIREDRYNKRQRVDVEKFNGEDITQPGLYTQEETDFRKTIPHTTNPGDEITDRECGRSGNSTIFAATTVNGISHLSTSTRLPKIASQEAPKSSSRSATGTLNFPVVKDPREPSTILRLSQGNSSQKGVETSPKNTVRFTSPTKPSQTAIKPSALHIQNSTTTSGGSSSEKIVASVMRTMKGSFPLGTDTNLFALIEQPPTREEVVETMQDFDLPQVIYQDAYYSNESDVPERAREWAGREFKLESLTVPYLPDFDATGLSAATYGEKPGTVVDKAKEESIFQKRRRLCGFRSWEIGMPPPTNLEILDWLRTENPPKNRSTVELTPNKYTRSPKVKNRLSQIDGPSQKNKHGFKYTQQKKTTSVKHEAQYMSTMSLEVHVNTRGNFVPNPEEDEVQCVFWCLQSDEHGSDSNGVAPGTHVGIVVLSEDGSMARKVEREMSVEVREEVSELDLLVRMVEIVRTHDPDILTGYEVHGNSWGYLIERARLKYDYNLCDEFSRMKSQSHGRFGKENDKWGFNNTSTIRVTGRHMINIWRAMRSELNLLQYTMENVAFHLLHRRIPHYSWCDLTHWYSNGRLRDLAKVLNYYVSRVQLDLAILESNELIPRTSEQARLLGVDFFSVFSRGSQFKVESLMFRIAKPENFILVSPSRKQVGGQNALECLPLVMEPQSAFYNSPLLVLDFQSLYPSVMIAYNYCYSTFLGRIVNWRGTNKMGFAEYTRQQHLLQLLQQHVNIAPNGMMYVKPVIRKSLLAKMLGEILETRVMVKSGMKVDKDDKALQRLLNNRQLALKLIANVTYGYTSASFSGRMPCSEIADSIVQTGRETLEKAIALIHSVKRWGAEVVYGDTDSLFVYLKGRTKDQAFDIGNEIAKMVTNMNPRPVKLKFEKVYFPCVLLAKKRYVGFKYESKDQKEPEFDAKGIETVRRDGTPAEQKIEEKALKILFRSADLSQVKSYFQEQCQKIMTGSVSIQDFCFAREVKLGTYSDRGPPPPGALISTRRMLEDARAEPQYGERVPYVVITGAPGARLIDRCVAPETLLKSDHKELDAEYYISKNLIPPLERIFNLVGANVRSWYDEMPKVQRIRRVNVNQDSLGPSNQLSVSRKTLESYMKSSSCLVCKEKLESEEPICTNCLSNRPTSLLALRMRLTRAEKKSQGLEKVCQSCSAMPLLDEVKCNSKDCPVFYSRTRQKAMLKAEKGSLEPIMRLLQGNEVDEGHLDW